MRVLIALLALLTLTVPVAWSDEGHHHNLTGQEIGSVHFATSCEKAVATNFNHAVALLHSFQYEQARVVFQDISHQGPKCAMGEWGIAMSLYHGL